MNSPDTNPLDHFQQLYLTNSDPWNVKESWYEQRKRALVLASLPRKQYENGYEPACGNGEMTLALARRCERLLAADGAEAAVSITRERLAQSGLASNVSVQQHRLPQDWPSCQEPGFDLILISELGYYLELDAMNSLAEGVKTCLAPGGTLLLCHALKPFGDRRLSTAQVHGVFHSQAGLQRIVHHKEVDFLLEVWTRV
ncbi:methyltransferase domain-containing protein [Undibacterium sp. TJN25]|uniref:methyltransferase domain-containing protein n=1 Tax=Undibacterium sp. TJN25 TaxID=3413056 RepID=UPI003BF0AAAD